MDTTPQTDLDAQRETIRRSLNEIANDIGMAMRDVGLHFPVFMTVRDNGDSLATIATPLEPMIGSGQQRLSAKSLDRKSVTVKYGAGNCSAQLQTQRR